jgi:hypothetical protein
LDEWMAGWMDGWLDEWMAGWMDGWMDEVWGALSFSTVSSLWFIGMFVKVKVHTLETSVGQLVSFDPVSNNILSLLLHFILFYNQLNW